ncbi:MAG: 2'-5' RNA ligase family protein [Halococcoides sp.]
MFSLNAPLPRDVHEIADRVAADYPPDTVRPRDQRTLVVKRLGDPTDAARLTARAREVVTDQPPIAARARGVVRFEDPPAGQAPVLALDIESPGLIDLHERLCAAFEPVEGIEGSAYHPHVTVARGPAVPDRAREASVEVCEWSIEHLQLYDASRHLSAGRIDLPA